MFNRRIISLFMCCSQSVSVRKFRNGDRLTTWEKEKIGEYLITKKKLFKLFTESNNLVYLKNKKVRNPDLQKREVDYVVYTNEPIPRKNYYDCYMDYFGDSSDKKGKITIDLKCCIGIDYSMKADDYNNNINEAEGVMGIPIEIKQNGEITFQQDKIYTDYFLYIIVDKHGVYYKFIKAEIIIKIVNQVLEGNAKYKIHTSFNGSGEYIKVPLKQLIYLGRTTII